MAASDVDICNLALIRCGQKKTLYQLADGTVEGTICQNIFPLLRDELLASFPWPFATRRATLTKIGEKDSTTPALAAEARGNWFYTYSLPTDCLVPRYLTYPGIEQVPADSIIPFDIESGLNNVGRVLVTNQEDAELVYTAAMVDVPSFSPAFVDALAWLIGRDLATGLSANQALATYCFQMFRASINNAATIELSSSRGESAQNLDSEFIRIRTGSVPTTSSS